MVFLAFCSPFSELVVQLHFPCECLLVLLFELGAFGLMKQNFFIQFVVGRMFFSGVQTSRGELRIHESLDDLSADLVEYVSELSDASVKERGVFAIALSGGSLIGLLGYLCSSFSMSECLLILICLVIDFLLGNRKLCEAPYNKTIDWAKWYVFWVDERVVAKSHADSNYKLAKDGLLSKVCSFALYLNSFFIC